MQDAHGNDTSVISNSEELCARITEIDNDMDLPRRQEEGAGDEDACETSANISTTDELYARITELEKKILNTESRLAHDDEVRCRGTATTPARGETATGTSTSSPPRPYDSEGQDAVADGTASPVSVVAGSPSSSIRRGVFTDETLATIERTRLSGTPPPSESEVDNELIREAKETSLLGKSPGDDQTDSEEEGSAFELV